MPNDLKPALTPDALRSSVQRILTEPPPSDGGQVDLAAIKTADDAGAEVRLGTGGSWWSLQAWAQWWQRSGWAAGSLGSFRWGGKKDR